jgi:RNA polymerase sigma factor (sigma-70 family)
MDQPRETPDVRDLLGHADWLGGLARRLIGDGDHDDAVQETWVAAMRSPPRGAAAAGPWLAQVLRNQVRRRWRAGALHRRVGAELTAAAEGAAAPSPEELLERARLQRVLADLVLGLEEPFRSTVLLRYYEGKSAAEIARALGIPAGTVRWRLSEAVEKLRGELDARERGGRGAWRALLAPLAWPASPSAPPPPPPPPSAITAAPAAAGGALIVAAKSKLAIVIGAVLLLLLVLGAVVQRTWWGPARDPATLAPVAERARAARVVMEDVSMPSASASAIEAVVRDPAGRPIEGALVALTRTSGPGSHAATDGNGRVLFDDAGPGEYRLGASAPAWLASETPPFRLAAGARKRVDIALRQGGQPLSGRVLDDGGGPIPGALVTVGEGYPWSAYVGMRGRPPLRFRAVTDEQGRYQLRLEAREYSLRAEAGGYVPAETTVPVNRAVVRDLRLQPAARVEGRVVDRGTGEPVAGARVDLRAGALDGPGSSTHTRADGAFVLDDVPAGAFFLHARSGALVGSSGRITTVPTQAVSGVEILVERAPGITGRVVDETGAGLAGVAVKASVLELGPPSVPASTTGADGEFAIEGTRPGRYRIFADGGAVGLTRAETTATVGVDGLRGLALVLSRAARAAEITGRVLGADGQPAPSVLVRAEAVRRQVKNTPAAVSGPDGRFTVSGVDPEAIELIAWHPAQGVHSVTLDALAPSERRQVELRLGAGAAIGGVVTWQDGAPAASVNVAFTRQEGAVIYDSVTSDEAGRYLVRGLLPGRYTVNATRKLGPRNMWTSREEPHLKVVKVSAGQARTDVDLTLRRGGKTIAGVVVFSDGTPAPGAVVVAHDRSWKPSATRVDHSAVSREDGRFAIDDVEDASFNLWATAPGHPEARLTGIAAGRSDVRIVVARPASIGGVVVGRDGRPVTEFAVAVLPGPVAGETGEQRQRRLLAERESPLRVRDAGGAFFVSGLAAGSYQVKVTSGTGAAGASQALTIGEGEQRSGVRLVVDGGARVRGQVIDADGGRALSGIRVSTQVGGRWIEVDTDAQGRFELDGVLPGDEVLIHVRSPGDEDVVPESVELVTAGATPGGAAPVVELPVVRLLRAPGWRARTDARGELGLAASGGGTAITAVKAGSPAEKAGLTAGDRVVAIDGRDVRGLGRGALSVLRARPPGGTITLTVQSPAPGSAPRTVTITVGARGNP